MTKARNTAAATLLALSALFAGPQAKTVAAEFVATPAAVTLTATN